MGFFAYIPFMECYHGIVSMSHTLEGALRIGGRTIDFNGGKGYIEKDWGTSFPKEYIWLQSNHFPGSDASVLCSVAHIPFGIASFQGFLCNLTVDGKEYRFATYNRSRLIRFAYTEETLDLGIRRGNLVFDVRATMNGGGMLNAPKQGAMQHMIKEGLSGTVVVRLARDDGAILFEGTGNPCGIELVRKLVPLDGRDHAGEHEGGKG
jgi:tocopherol cyclase